MLTCALLTDSLIVPATRAGTCCRKKHFRVCAHTRTHKQHTLTATHTHTHARTHFARDGGASAGTSQYSAHAACDDRQRAHARPLAWEAMLGGIRQLGAAPQVDPARGPGFAILFRRGCRRTGAESRFGIPSVPDGL
eukprot:15473702-Alexandrium_andersonii.AAC.1